MLLVIANVIGWIVAHWRMVLTIVGLIFVLTAVALLWNRCKKEVKFDQATVDKINNGNRKEREQELRKKVEDNADVIKTVDGRTEITNVNVVERNREIDARVKAADDAILAAKSQGRDVTQDDLECLLVPENCK